MHCKWHLHLMTTVLLLEQTQCFLISGAQQHKFYQQQEISFDSLGLMLSMDNEMSPRGRTDFSVADEPALLWNGVELLLPVSRRDGDGLSVRSFTSETSDTDETSHELMFKRRSSSLEFCKSDASELGLAEAPLSAVSDESTVALGGLENRAFLRESVVRAA